jgi:hypothetical protein
MTDEDDQTLAPLALHYLQSSDPVDASQQFARQSAPNAEQIKLAALSFLSTLLKHDMTAWLDDMSDEQRTGLCQWLLLETQHLINPELPESASCNTLSCAMLSTSLLSLIQWKSNADLSDLDRIVNSTSLVENVIQFALPSPLPETRHHGPRWTWDDQNNERARVYALELLYCWSLSGRAAWTIFGKQESQWRPYMENFWSSILDHRSHEFDKTLQGIFLLHISSRLAARASLLSVIQGRFGRDDDIVKPCHAILSSLYEMCRDVSLSGGGNAFDFP